MAVNAREPGPVEHLLIFVQEPVWFQTEIVPELRRSTHGLALWLEFRCCELNHRPKRNSCPPPQRAPTPELPPIFQPGFSPPHWPAPRSSPPVPACCVQEQEERADQLCHAR